VRLIVLFIAWLFSMAGIAQAKDMSGYPCDVFAGPACFRLPTGTALEYSVPADYGLYRVIRESNEVATIYVGFAPEQPANGVTPAWVRSRDASIRVFRQSAGLTDHIDIYISRRKSGDIALHLSAEMTAATREDVFSLVSSLRTCKPIKSGGQRCNRNAEVGRKLMQALQ
jgi:hypothetical protein